MKESTNKGSFMKEFKGRFCDDDNSVFHLCSETEFATVAGGSLIGSSYTPWVMPTYEPFNMKRIFNFTLEGVSFNRAITVSENEATHCYIQCDDEQIPMNYMSFESAAQYWINLGHGDFRFATYPAIISLRPILKVV
jgi:hypothetical protein